MPIIHAAIDIHENNRYLFSLSEEKFHLFDLEIKDCGEIELNIKIEKNYDNILVYINKIENKMIRMVMKIF
jgi:hypothetical protein